MAVKLGLLSLMAVLSVWYLGWYRRKISLRWGPAIFLRLGLIALLLAGFYLLVSKGQGEAADSIEVLVLDVSESISEQGLEDARDSALDWQDDRQGRCVVIFGEENAAVLDETWPEVSGLGSDLNSALQTAEALLPEEGGRILIATDGSIPDPEKVSEYIQNLTNRGVQIDLIPLNGLTEGKDIYLAGLETPSSTWSDSEISIEVTIFALEKGTANIGFIVNGVLQQTIPVEVTTGLNQLIFNLNSGEEGIMLLEATVKWEGERFDPFISNNTMFAAVEVYPPVRVLLVSAETDEAFRLLSNLREVGLEAEMVSPKDLTSSLSELSGYQAVLLQNVLARDLSYEQMLGLETFVVDFGRALLLFGGRSSYNLGGYENTVLEPLLPVDLRPPSRIERVPATYVMVLDRSGSMLQDESTDVSPMELTKEAAIRAMESLRPDDYLGVLTFASSYSWQVELSQVGDGMSLRLAQDAVSQVQAAGGTLISAALEEALAQIIMNSPTEYRHILLMSDGSGNEEVDTLDQFSVLAAIAQRQNTTISTIALGSESDPETMAFIANQGNGRFYEVLDPTDLPGVMVAESKAAHSENVQLGQTNVVSGVFDHPILSGFQTTAFPSIWGYNAVSSKANAGAEDILVSGNFGDPILSSWQVGLGHVVAWMSDLGAEWATGFDNWTREGEFWKRVIYASLPDPSFDLAEVEVHQTGGQLSLLVRVFDYDGTPVNTLEPRFTYLDLDKQLVAVPLAQTGIGEYQAAIDSPPVGAYRGVVQYQRLGTQFEVGVPFSVNYPAEWAFDYSGEGGRNIEAWQLLDSVGLTSFDQELNPEVVDSWLDSFGSDTLLMVLLIVLWPVEIAIRRWKLPWRRP